MERFKARPAACSTAGRRWRLATLAAAATLAMPAWATNGYFPHGYGLKAKGMGGASLALSQDSLGGANNPASMVWAGERVDLGLDAFSPKRDAERTGAGFATLNGQVDSDKTVFWVPEVGYNRMLGSNLSLGMTLYGNGGMNTTYPQGSFNCGAGPANMLCGSGTLGVDLSQLIVAPTLAYKVTPTQSVGIALLLGYQRFKAEGLQAFDNAPGFPAFTSAPGSVTNNGYDSSTGVGVRLGWQGKFGAFTAGAAYAPKMNMGRFEKYKGLFAGQGDFDIPSHYGAGIAFSATPTLTVTLDAMRINYSDVPAVSNPSSNAAPLGADNGPGFGWQDINVYKLGLQWQMSPALTLRAGYNRGDNPIGSADVSFNILAPGVMTDHYTAGFTFALSPTNEITGALMIAPRKTVSGSSFFNAVLGPGAGGNETIGMKQSAFGLAWAIKF
ncbi:MAG: outer membrane protein transport protein [Betaproteobacteria bacterium]|nr:outer membrane protein transport protein [Betaproteobacteria bacterium]MCC6247583.1 outer membrane protein transport protein [Rubrivivax sp.]MCL4697662.1 outer membrane protein transport protein [Burkholderiaceae bacterium]